MLDGRTPFWSLAGGTQTLFAAPADQCVHADATRRDHAT